MALYKLYTVLPKLVKFIDTLCNWYVRLNRRRLRGETGSEDSYFALNTLFNVMFLMLKLCAPFIPFLTESMYQRIKKYLGPISETLEFDSIHYLLVPEINENLIDQTTEKLVNLMQRVILLGRTVRDRKTLPLRHPVKELVVFVEDYPTIEDDILHVRPYIFEELNVKQLKLTKQKEEYGIQMKVKPNFKVLALKAKDKMKKLSAEIEKMTDAQVSELREKGKFVLDGYELVVEDVIILPKISAKFSQFEADFDENVTILLDVTPDEEMLNEGVLRDVVNRVQRLRKEFKIVPTDELVVYFQVANQESKLNALLKRSVEYLETNIKKPVRLYDNSLTLNVKGKVFEVKLN